jgi:hypothetical protein
LAVTIRACLPGSELEHEGSDSVDPRAPLAAIVAAPGAGRHAGDALVTI